jgi:Putative transposase
VRENFFVPEAVLSKRFRRNFVEDFKQTFAQGKLQFHGQLQALANPKIFRSFLRQLFPHRWVVYCKPHFGGPDQVLRYLGAYTHRVAISNHRLVSLIDDQVTFRWRDSAHKNKKRLMTLPAEEFLRRFLLHVLPRGFVRIRHYGFLASRCRRQLVPLCKQLLTPVASTPTTPTPTSTPASPESAPMWICPRCGGPMIVIERLTAGQIALRSPPPLANTA